jgi:hypothetical protein
MAKKGVDEKGKQNVQMGARRWHTENPRGMSLNRPRVTQTKNFH